MIAVTGGTGHIGNVLVRELVARGEQVRVLALPTEDTRPLDGLPIEIVPGDVLNSHSLEVAFSGADLVYHVAGLVSSFPWQEQSVDRVNVQGTSNVLSACEKAGVRRLVYTSSIHSLVEPPHGAVIDESCGFDPDRSRGGYDKSKAIASIQVLQAVERGLDAVIVCPTGVIGPFDFRVSIMGRVLLDLARNSLWAIPDGGYNFVDVRDVAIGHILAAEKGKPGEVYILAGECISVADLARMVDELHGRRPRFRLRVPAWLTRVVAHVSTAICLSFRVKSRITKYSVETLLSNCNISNAKARRELGYTSRSLRDSVWDSIRWFADNGVV